MARKMKDSGIKWIGEMPEDWKILSLKYLCNMQAGKNLNSEQISIDGEFPVYGGNGLRGYYHTFNCEGLKILVGRQGALCGNVHKVDGKYWATEHAIITEHTDLCDANFLSYLLIGMNLNQYVTSTAAQPGLAVSTIQNIKTCIPKTDEQIRIASFLDNKCARIDSILNKTRTSIEEYKKLKQSIITQAVTKGIRPNRKMKDSGIEWIGEIPEEWDIRRAKYYVNISHGSDPKTKGDIPVYGSGTESFKSCGEYKEGPCVLVGRKGATLHIPHYIDHRYWNVDTAFDVHEKENFCLKFYYYLACCFDYKYYISQTTLPGMTQTDYENMILPIPTNKGEQEEISDYLDEKTSVLEKMIERKEQLLTELENYKKSLIFEYVTGKKEVSVA